MAAYNHILSIFSASFHLITYKVRYPVRRSKSGVTINNFQMYIFAMLAQFLIYFLFFSRDVCEFFGKFGDFVMPVILESNNNNLFALWITNLWKGWFSYLV